MMINITREQFFDFIKTKKDKDGTISKPTQHYLDYFDKYQSTGKKGSWNWSSFWGSMSWFLYRRMYLYGISYPLATFISSTLLFFPIFFTFPALIKYAPYLGTPLGLLIGALISHYADYIYLHYSSKKIAKGKTHSGVNKTLIIAPACLVAFWVVIAVVASLLAKH